MIPSLSSPWPYLHSHPRAPIYLPPKSHKNYYCHNQFTATTSWTNTYAPIVTYLSQTRVEQERSSETRGNNNKKEQNHDQNVSSSRTHFDFFFSSKSQYIVIIINNIKSSSFFVPLLFPSFFLLMHSDCIDVPIFPG